MNNQKNSLKYFCISEFIQRFSFYGIQSSLIFYFIKVFSLPNNAIYLTYGAFTGLSFATSIIGGFLADKWFGFRKLVLTGMCLSLIGI